MDIGWGCSTSPSLQCSALCGDGLVRDTETCDDGTNFVWGGCTNDCTQHTQLSYVPFKSCAAGPKRVANAATDLEACTEACDSQDGAQQSAAVHLLDQSQISTRKYSFTFKAPKFGGGVLSYVVFSLYGRGRKEGRNDAGSKSAAKGLQGLPEANGKISVWQNSQNSILHLEPKAKMTLKGQYSRPRTLPTIKLRHPRCRRAVQQWSGPEGAATTFSKQG